MFTAVRANMCRQNAGSRPGAGSMAAMNDGTTTTGNNLTVTDPSTFAMDRSDGTSIGVEVPVTLGLRLGSNENRVQHANAAGHNSTLG